MNRLILILLAGFLITSCGYNAPIVYKQEYYTKDFWGIELKTEKLLETAATSDSFLSYYNQVFVKPFDGTQTMATRFTTKKENVVQESYGNRPWRIFYLYCKSRKGEISSWSHNRDYLVACEVDGKPQIGFYYNVSYEPSKSNIIDPYVVTQYYVTPGGINEYLLNLKEAGRAYDDEKRVIARTR